MTNLLQKNYENPNQYVIDHQLPEIGTSNLNEEPIII